MPKNAEEGPDPDSEHQDENGDGRQGKRAGITIELTPGQVHRVVLGAADTGNIAVFLSGQIDGEMLARESELLSDPHISASFMRGLMVFSRFPKDGRNIGVVELSKKLKLNPSTTHRYLATLVLAGLIERDASSRKYRLAK